MDRAARLILSRGQRGEASTADPRKAVVQLRVLFRELPGATTVKHSAGAATRSPA